MDAIRTRILKDALCLEHQLRPGCLMSEGVGTLRRHLVSEVCHII